jgi:nitrogen regulatory protein P-II 1
MELGLIMAVVRGNKAEAVEKKLQGMGIKGISVSRVKGFGEYANFFTGDWMVPNVKLEIIAEKPCVDEIARVIMAAAHTGVQGDGFVAVLPVEKLYRIKSKAEALPEEVC